MSRLPLVGRSYASKALLALLRRLEQRIVDHGEVGYDRHLPLAFRIRPRNAFARIGILDHPYTVPDKTPGV